MFKLVNKRSLILYLLDMLSPLILDATDNLLHLLVQLKVLALQLVNLLHQAVNPSLCLLLSMHYIRKGTRKKKNRGKFHI